MGDDGTTIGTYFNADEQEGLLSEFDERFEDDPGRSAAVKNAMELSLAVESALDATGYEFEHPREKRMFVRQAILDKFRAEQAEGD